MMIIVLLILCISFSYINPIDACPFYIVNTLNHQTNFSNYTAATTALWKNQTLNGVILYVCDGSVILSEEFPLQSITQALTLRGIKDSGSYLRIQDDNYQTTPLNVFTVGSTAVLTLEYIRFMGNVTSKTTLITITQNSLLIINRSHMYFIHRAIVLNPSSDTSISMETTGLRIQNGDFGINLYNGLFSCEFCDFDKLKNAAITFTTNQVENIDNVFLPYVHFVDVLIPFAVLYNDGTFFEIGPIPDEFILTYSLTNCHTYDQACVDITQSQSPNAPDLGSGVGGGGSGNNNNKNKNNDTPVSLALKIIIVVLMIIIIIILLTQYQYSIMTNKKTNNKVS